MNRFQAQIFFGQPCHDVTQQLMALLLQPIQLPLNWIGQDCLPPIAWVEVEAFWMPTMGVDPMVVEVVVVAGLLLLLLLLLLLPCHWWCPLGALTAGVVVV